jgi:TPR repeat protein
MLGNWFENKLWGLPRSLKEASKCYLQAANLGNIEVFMAF